MKRSAVPALKSLLCAFLLLGACAQPALAWWNSDWPLRKAVVVDTTAAGFPIAEPIDGAAVLVRLHDGNFPFSAVKPDGSDLRFIAADDKTPLPFHLERFDPLLNEAYAWVRLADLKPNAKSTFWLYYGNAAAAVARADDAPATYDADTVLVYHFTEHGAPAADSSASALHTQNAGTAAQGAQIAGGLRLDGRSALTIAAAPKFDWIAGTSLTWTAWFRVTTAQPHAVIFQRGDAQNSFAVGLDGGVPFAEIVTQGVRHRSSAGAPVEPGGWHHLALVAEGAAVQLYLDGEPYVAFDARLPALTGPATIGGESARGAPGFTGEIDELQILRNARSAGWIKFAAAGQGGDQAGKLLTVGEEEQPKSLFGWLKGGYVGVIIGSLSFDGWVVIAILVVMGVVSWIVMIGKARYLNRVAAGNERFLKEWRHVASDLSVLDHADGDHARSLGGRVGGDDAARAMRRAPLFHLYHVGVEEIRHRLASDRSNRVLSARSIEAIRAALDGTLVRETQRLGSQMVLLTIAISGGPFLGLLGTVVGVMITFAAVAAAGDVNVNAIAPGIAAALAATVAGLAVAIPALFGYNYLLTRVKSATSDMHVFIDEFVAKLAEFYSEPPDPRATARPAAENLPARK